jgi:uncharacterized integral membrane protein
MKTVVNLTGKTYFDAVIMAIFAGVNVAMCDLQVLLGSEKSFPLVLFPLLSAVSAFFCVWVCTEFFLQSLETVE